MSRFDEFRRIRDAAVDAARESGSASKAIDKTKVVAKSAVDEAKVTNRKGNVTKTRVVVAAVRPHKTGRRLLKGAAQGMASSASDRQVDTDRSPEHPASAGGDALRIDGVYCSSPLNDYRYYFRFYADGRVVGTTISGVDIVTPSWLGWTHDGVSRGQYRSTGSAETLEFDLTSNAGVVTYSGAATFADDSATTLHIDIEATSHINGNRSAYRIAPVEHERERATGEVHPQTSVSGINDRSGSVPNTSRRKHMEPKAADWYPDPSGEFNHRYWDGQKWTEHVSQDGKALTDAGWPPEEPGAQVQASSDASAQTPEDSADATTLRMVHATHAAITQMMDNYQACFEKAEQVEKGYAVANTEYINGVRQHEISKQNFRKHAEQSERQLEGLLGELRTATAAAEDQWNNLVLLLPGSDNAVMKIANWCMSHGVDSEIFSSIVANGAFTQTDFGRTRESFWAENERVVAAMNNAGQ